MAGNGYLKNLNTQASAMLVATADGSGVRLKPEIVEKINLITPNETPFTFLMESAGRKAQKASQFEITYQEEYPIPAGLKAVATATAVATSITVDTTAYVMPRMVMVNLQSREQILITAVDTATNILTVVRGWGETPGRAITAGCDLMLTGFLGQEAQDAFNGVMRVPDSRTAYLEEIGWGVGLSEWSKLVSWRGPSERDRINMQGIRTFKRNREARRLFGEKKLSTDSLGGSTNRIYSSAGLRSYCYQYNIVDLNGSINWDAFAYGMLGILEYADGQNFIGLTSRANLVHLTTMDGFREAMQTTPAQTKMGFDLKKIEVTGGGSVNFLAHPMMGAPGVDKEILVFRMDDIELHELRPFLVRPNIQTPGSHREAWELSRIEGIIHKNPRGCGVFRNVRA